MSEDNLTFELGKHLLNRFHIYHFESFYGFYKCNGLMTLQLGFQPNEIDLDRSMIPSRDPYCRSPTTGTLIIVLVPVYWDIMGSYKCNFGQKQPKKLSNSLIALCSKNFRHNTLLKIGYFYVTGFEIRGFDRDRIRFLKINFE